MTKREKQLVNALAGLMRIIEGDSGAGANYWDDDKRYIEARELLKQYEPKQENRHESN